MTSEIYASTSCLRGYSYSETLDEYEQAGIGAVELGYCPDDKIVLDKLVESYSFDFVAHNYFLPDSDEFVVNLSSTNDSILQRSISYVRDGIDFCARNGIGRYTIHSGFRVDPDENFNFETDNVPAVSTCMETFVESLGQILPYAKKRGVSVAIENNVVEERHVINGEPVVLLADTDEFKQLLKRVEVDVLLDVGHLKVASETLGFNRETFLNVVDSQVSHIHLHTNAGDTDEHLPIEVGDWGFDVWQRFDNIPTTVEAKFDDTQELNTHIRELSQSRV